MTNHEIWLAAVAMLIAVAWIWAAYRLSRLNRLLRLERQKTEHMEQIQAGLQETSRRCDAISNEKLALQIELAEALARHSEKIALVDQFRTERNAASTALEQKNRELADIRAAAAANYETLRMERQKAEGRERQEAESRQLLLHQFQTLASEILRQHSVTFAEQNKAQITDIVLPFRDNLKDLQQELRAAYKASDQERAGLQAQIRTFIDAQALLRTETERLALALKGNTRTQGAWGELVLTTVLECSGLRKGEEYLIQESFSTDDGRRRPDAIVKLPQECSVIIDAKVTLTAFLEYNAATSEAERQTQVAALLRSIRSHIDSLATKDYAEHSGSPLDFVIMFVPIESALALALQAEPELWQYASEKRISLATPTTLLMALKTINSVWQVDRRNRNAEQIADIAGKMLDKLVGFVEDMENLGRKAVALQLAYDQAMGKLTRGRGNIIGKAIDLKNLGAKTTSSFPSSVLIGSDDAPLERIKNSPERENEAQPPAALENDSTT